MAKTTHDDRLTTHLHPAMDRRGFLKATSAAAGTVAVVGTSAVTLSGAEAAAAGPPAVSAAGASTFATPSINAGLRQITLAVPGSVGEAAAGSEAFRLARRLEDALGDGLSVAVTQTSSGVSDGLATAEFDLMLSTGFALTNTDAAFKMFAGLPLGIDLDPIQHTSWLVAGGGQSLWDDLAQSHGLKALLAGWTGPGEHLCLRTIDDGLKGRRVSAHGLVADAARVAGADIVAHQDHELEHAFASNMIDAAQPIRQPLNPISAYTVEPGLMPNGAFVALTSRASFWSKLDRREQAVVAGIAAESFQISAAEHLTRARMAQSVASYRASTSTTLRSLDRARLQHAASVAVSELAASSATARRIVASHQSWRELMTGTQSATLS